MEKISATLTVLFEDPFWVGVFERRYDDKIEVAKVTFEKEPKEALKLQLEERKLERKKSSREQREAEKQKQFELRQKKRHEKHRGH